MLIFPIDYRATLIIFYDFISKKHIVIYTLLRAGTIVGGFELAFWIVCVMVTTGFFRLVPPCTVLAAVTVLEIGFTVKDVGVRPVVEALLIDDIDTLNTG
jgi:hypothetical protein